MRLKLKENPVCSDCIHVVITYDIMNDYGKRQFDVQDEFEGTELELRDYIRDIKVKGAYNIEVISEPGVYYESKKLKESSFNEREKIANNIASWAFGSPNPIDIDDNLDYLITRFFKNTNETFKDMIYSSESVDELEYALSQASLSDLKKAERGLCIDDYSIGIERDYIDSMYGESFSISKRTNLTEQDVEIEVKHEGVLEVPEGKNVDDLPISHFEKLAKRKGLGKITKALNNLQVWNKKKNPSLSKWAGDMIDKLNKRMKKNESFIRESGRYDYYDTPDNEYEMFMRNDLPTEEDDWWASISSELRAVVHEMEETGWEGVGFTTSGVDYCISKQDKNRPELSYEMCVNIYDMDNSVSLSKYVDIYDWNKEKVISRIPNSSGVSEFRTDEDVRRFSRWFKSL